MKSIINFLLVAALPAIMVACGGAANEAETQSETGSQSAEQAITVDAPEEEIDVNANEETESVPAEPEEMSKEPALSEDLDSTP